MTQQPDKRKAVANKCLPKAGVTSFYGTFLLNRTLVFQINRSAETTRLRQAQKVICNTAVIFMDF